MTEPLGAGNSREYDILGIKMFDSAELRVHMTGKAILRTGREVAGPGPRDDVGADRRPRARHPGRGHRRRGGRHRHRAVRDGHLRLPQHAGRRRRGRDGVAQDPGQGPQARRAPARGVRGGRRVGARPLLRAQRARTGASRIQECAMAAYSNMPDGMEPGLEDNAYYDPPNLTWPFACYIATVEVDPRDRRVGRAQRRRGRRLRRPDQPDDRRGPDHGRPDRGLRDGEHAVHHLRRRRQLHRRRTSWTTCCRPRGRRPGYELHEVVTPCPHHPIGAKGVGECATVGGPAAFVNAVMDAIKEHRRPQHRHAAAARPGLRGAHPAARRLRRAAGEDGRLMSDRHGLTTAGRSSSRPPSCAGRGEEFALATVVWRQGPSSGQQGSRAIITADGAGARLDRRRLRRAGRDPRGAAGDPSTASRGCCCSARPSSSAPPCRTG